MVSTRTDGSRNSRFSLRRGEKTDRMPEPPLRATLRQHFVAMTGELVGTILFLWFAFSGTQLANIQYSTNDPNRIMFIALSFGFSLMVNAWVFYRVSGGLFNPAVTLGLCLAGALPWLRGVALFPAQFLGGLIAAGLASAMFPGPLLVDTRLGGDASIAQGLFIEMFLTAMLVLTVLFLAAEKSKTTFVAPVGIGIALFVSELSGAFFTGGSLNPIRSFGPAAVNHSFPGYHWIYWLGPALGASLAAGYHRFAKLLRFEEANPGQDAADPVEADLEAGRVRSM